MQGLRGADFIPKVFILKKKYAHYVNSTRHAVIPVRGEVLVQVWFWLQQEDARTRGCAFH